MTRYRIDVRIQIDTDNILVAKEILKDKLFPIRIERLDIYKEGDGGLSFVHAEY